MGEHLSPFAHDMSTSDENPPRNAEISKLDRDFDSFCSSSDQKK
jgi:hypothetical protein